MISWELVFIFLTSLAVGSFMGAASYRAPKGLGFIKGRSFCDHCKKSLSFKYNIPLLSFFLLNGKSACCGRKISVRYPLIEITTGSLSTVVFLFSQNFWFIPLTWLLVFILTTDIEHMIIFDEAVFLIFGLGFLFILFNNQNILFPSLFASFSASFIFLILNFVTKGAGMGLGDVKLAASLGLWLGVGGILNFIILSFLTGGIIASILLLTGKAKVKTKIAFGPFLVIAFLLVLVFGVKVVPI